MPLPHDAASGFWLLAIISLVELAIDYARARLSSITLACVARIVQRAARRNAVACSMYSYCRLSVVHGDFGLPMSPRRSSGTSKPAHSQSTISSRGLARHFQVSHVDKIAMLLALLSLAACCHVDAPFVDRHRCGDQMEYWDQHVETPARIRVCDDTVTFFFDAHTYPNPVSFVSTDYGACQIFANLVCQRPIYGSN
jgi:hypothetical protein